VIGRRLTGLATMANQMARSLRQQLSPANAGPFPLLRLARYFLNENNDISPSEV
jgi:hypothetical protein